MEIQERARVDPKKGIYFYSFSWATREKNIPCIVKKMRGWKKNRKFPFFDDLILLLLKQKRIEEDIDVECKTMNILATQLHVAGFHPSWST